MNFLFKYKSILVLLILVTTAIISKAQAPINDSCHNADTILIANNGFELGHSLATLLI